MSRITPYAELHVHLSGAGDARPTAQRVIEDQNLKGKLRSKTILITGATSGIGIETARALYTTGAQIYITARDMIKGAEVASSIATDPSRPVEVIEMVLDSLASIKAGAASLLEKTDTLNVLINNAGVMAPPAGKTVDGFETQFGTNHLGHFLLFQLLRPALVAGAAGSPDFASRVISVSSAGHRMIPSIRFDDLNWDDPEAYDKWQAYGQSKLANIYFATELERQYGSSQRLHAFSLHPGSIITPLQKYIMDDPLRTKAASDPAYIAQIKTPEQGAATSVWAAVAKELEGKGGLYLENVGEAGEADAGIGFGLGYAPWAFDKNAETRLWWESLRLVGMGS